MSGRLNRLRDRARKVTIYDRSDGRDPVDFLGTLDEAAQSPETIAEAEMTRVAVAKQPLRGAIAEALGFGEPVWMLLGEARARIFPDDPDGKPGDFDIMVGPLRDGRPALAPLGMVEVKRSPVRADGKPKSRPSGLGTTQARGGALLGFDRVLLAHFVLGPDESIRTPPGKVAIPEHYEVVDRIVKNIRRADPLGPGRRYGTLVVEWARARASSIERTGAVSFLLGDSAPRLTPTHDRRQLLDAHLRAVLPREDCPPYLWRCDVCAEIACVCSPSPRPSGKPR